MTPCSRRRASFSSSSAELVEVTCWMYWRAAASCAAAALRRVLGHLVAAGDEVDEHAEVRDDDDEDHPQRLGPAGEVVAAEDVAEDDDQDVDPDEEQEEPEHRPEHLAGAPFGGDDGHGHAPRVRGRATSGGQRPRSRRDCASRGARRWVTLRRGGAVAPSATTLQRILARLRRNGGTIPRQMARAVVSGGRGSRRGCAGRPCPAARSAPSARRPRRRRARPAPPRRPGSGCPAACWPARCGWPC